ncbi:MAG: PAS domain-containing protein, partial [Anaerolineae bacterium]|nr:PAS domain-containing protein [Anaerolineae bacterium]
MSDKRKTKAQLIDELTELRQRVAYLEQAERDPIHQNGSQQPDPPERDQLLFDTLIKYLPDYVYFKDGQGRIILSNAAKEQLHAGGRASITGGNIRSKLQSSEPQPLPDAEIIRTGVPVMNAETIVVDDSGSERWILSTRAPVVNEADEVIGLLGIERDITADKLRIIELQHRMQEMASVHQQTIVYAKDLAREISEHKETTQELQRQIEQKELAHQQSIIYAKELREEIVERKRVEAELNLYKEYLEERAEQLAVLHQLDQAITASLHINDIYEALAHQVQRLLPYDRIAIAILNDEHMQLTYVTGVGNTATPIGTMFPAETSALGAVV